MLTGKMELLWGMFSHLGSIEKAGPNRPCSKNHHFTLQLLLDKLGLIFALGGLFLP